MYVLPELAYAYDALEPVMSERTLRFHHDRHHAGYVKALNDLLGDWDTSAGTLEAVIVEAANAGKPALFNNAAQAWNHSFFWQAMSATRGEPTATLATAIQKTFGDLARLKTALVEAGAAHFGSGWVWLDTDLHGALSVRCTHDADNALSQEGTTPLLVCDLWEHAYYLDHQNNRKGFLEAWFDALPNWQFATRQFDAAQGRGARWSHPAPARTEPKISKAG